jgi:hypothetical protein
MLMTEEGFTTIARLKGEDAVDVADFIDKVCLNMSLNASMFRRCEDSRN